VAETKRGGQRNVPSMQRNDVANSVCLSLLETRHPFLTATHDREGALAGGVVVTLRGPSAGRQVDLCAVTPRASSWWLGRDGRAKEAQLMA
jgi:hypothetical protein